jgi:hypothetical protein
MGGVADERREMRTAAIRPGRVAPALEQMESLDSYRVDIVDSELGTSARVE